jgi:hypothetical protein
MFHTVPYGTGPVVDPFLAMNCQATIIQSLRDIQIGCRPIGLVPRPREGNAPRLANPFAAYIHLRIAADEFLTSRRDSSKG